MRRNLSRTAAFVLFFVTVVLLLALDRYAKFLAVSALSGGGSIAVIPGVIDLMLVYNEGAAFGIFQGARVFFIIIAAIASVGIIIYLAITKRHSLLQVFALALICTGAVGNAIDRALTGKVVDFVHTLFIEFPVFNIADSAITLGVIAFMISLFLHDDSASGKHLRDGDRSVERRKRIHTVESGSTADSDSIGDRFSDTDTKCAPDQRGA